MTIIERHSNTIETKRFVELGVRRCEEVLKELYGIITAYSTNSVNRSSSPCPSKSPLYPGPRHYPMPHESGIHVRDILCMWLVQCMAISHEQVVSSRPTCDEVLL
jgi:hypothetical protein